MLRRMLLLTAAVALLAGAAACSYEPRKATMHSPGVYKGERDPLLDKRNEQDLIQRFKLVQADR